jgi:hypothetical protein
LKLQFLKEFKMETTEIITLAKARLHEAQMLSSAAICLHDAETLLLAGDHKFARSRAQQSLKYSIGIFHPDYQRAVL